MIFPYIIAYVHTTYYLLLLGVLFVVSSSFFFRYNTENLLRWILKHKLVPILVFNEMDKVITNDPEKLYLQLESVINELNLFMDVLKDPSVGDISFSPAKGIS